MIVVSDGSIDETAERLLAARGDLGIRVIHYDRNLGKGYAVKAGALAARGDWIALIDADLDLDPAADSGLPRACAARGRSTSRSARSGIRTRSSTTRARGGSRAGATSSSTALLFRLDVRDTQVGLKVFSRESSTRSAAAPREAVRLRPRAPRRCDGARPTGGSASCRFGSSTASPARRSARRRSSARSGRHGGRLLPPARPPYVPAQARAARQPAAPPVDRLPARQPGRRPGRRGELLDYPRSSLVAARVRRRPGARRVTCSPCWPGRPPGRQLGQRRRPVLRRGRRRGGRLPDARAAARAAPRARRRCRARVAARRPGRAGPLLPGQRARGRPITRPRASSCGARTTSRRASTAFPTTGSSPGSRRAGSARSTRRTRRCRSRPPPLVGPHLSATCRLRPRAGSGGARRARGRASAARRPCRSARPPERSRGRCSSWREGPAAVPARCSCSRTRAMLAFSGLHAAVRFRSLVVGLLHPPAVIATHAAYLVGFVRGLLGRASRYRARGRGVRGRPAAASPSRSARGTRARAAGGGATPRASRARARSRRRARQRRTARAPHRPRARAPLRSAGRASARSAGRRRHTP